MITAILALLAVQSQGELLKTFRDEFVEIKPGGFSMGSPGEGPVHEVTLTRSFSIAKYEVPQNLWESVMGSNPSRWKGRRNSVEMLSFADAREFCSKVSDAMRASLLIGDTDLIRLPTEAEWEYCARAGTKTAYSFGDDAKELGEHAWFTGNAAGNDPPVGAKKPNPWKLYDMHGYLWEWCSDSWHDSYEGAPADGRSWEEKGAEFGVLRGGSWKDEAAKLTSSHRRKAARELKDDAVGLRCVLAAERTK